MRILVTYGSKRGGTEGIGRMLAQALRERGHDVDVCRAGELDGIEAWDAVIVGGALYAGRWHREARRFVARHRDELRRVPVWLFSSGPLDESASRQDIAPTAQVGRIAADVRAREHATFGGRLEPTARGLIARALVRQGKGGDFRDVGAIDRWAGAIAADVDRLPATDRARRAAPTRARVLRRIAGALTLFTGLTAILGGATLVSSPRGGTWMKVSLDLLQHSPFTNFLVPGLLLLVAVGVVNLLGGLLVLRRHRWGEVWAFSGGATVTGWIVIEMALFRAAHPFHLLYVSTGVAIMALAFRLFRIRRAGLEKRPSESPPAIPDATSIQSTDPAPAAL